MAKRQKKDRLGSFKRMLRNQQLLFRILIRYPELNKELVELGTSPAVEETRKKLSLNDKTITLPLCFDNFEKMMNVGLMLVQSLDKETRGKIIAFIEKFMVTTELGQEWFRPLLTYITAGIVCPPYQNFHIERNGKRIILTLNPDTSIDDLRNEWPAIDGAVHEAWPDFEKTNLSSKFNEEVQEYIQSIKAKQNISDDFKYRDLSEFETMLAKRSNNPEAEISSYRKRRKIVENVPVSPVRIYTKKTDRDVVKELYGVKSKPTQTRKMNALRQRKHRLET